MSNKTYSRREVLTIGAAGAAAFGLPMGSATAATKWDMPTAYGAGNFISKAYVAFAEDVKSQTDGELEIAVHPGGSLYKGGDILRAVREGQVPLGGRFLGAHSTEVPVLGLDTIPFLATDRDQARRLYDVSKSGVESVLAERGLKLLFAPVWPPQGLFSKKAINRVEDMQGVKFRAYDSSTTRLAELMGAVPTKTEASEIAQAFSTGVAESMMASGAIGTWQKIWEYCDYLYLVNAWLPKSGAIVNADAWDKLDAKAQSVVSAAGERAESAVWDEMEVQNEGYLKTMTENGMTIGPPSEELLSGLNAIGETMTQEWIDSAGEIGAKIIDAYRAG